MIPISEKPFGPIDPDSIVYDHLSGMQQALSDMKADYRNIFMRPVAENDELENSLALRSEFDTALHRAILNFSSEQKIILKENANPKASKLWDEFGADSNDPNGLIQYLRLCFTDSCGHLMPLSVVGYGVFKPERARRNMELGGLISFGLRDVFKNFSIILGDSVDIFPAIQELSTTFSANLDTMQQQMINLARHFQISDSELHISTNSMVEQSLNGSHTIAYIKPIDVARWDGHHLNS